MNHTSSPQLAIDLRAVLQSRMGRYYRLLPSPLVEWLRLLVCEDQLNEMLRVNDGRTGVDFSRGVLEHLNVTYDVHGSFPASRRVVVVSNHPLGGLDGMAMSCAVADAYGSQGVKFVVNDLLEAIVPMRPIFLPVNKLGNQSREATRRLDQAFAGPDPVIMFPAGLVSRRGKSGAVADLKWHKMGVQKAIASKRDIVPVYFSGVNSPSFYRAAQWRTRLGLKFNLEMALLPREVFRARDSHYHIVVGESIPWQSLTGGRQAQQQADALREKVYELRQTWEANNEKAT